MEKINRFFMYGILIGVLISMFSLLMYMIILKDNAVKIFGLTDKCSENLRITCELNNKLVDTTNGCTNLLGKYSGFKFENLTYLNCDRLP
jgi:hypothetical protein